MRFDETICCYAGTDQNNRQVEVKNYIGHLNKDDMENINKTLLCSLGIT